MTPSGTMVVRYSYDAWGNILSITGSLANSLGKNNPFRYRSYYYDNETGWYYLKSRYYDPSICRFISPDSLLQAGGGADCLNLYAYCLNNPVNMYDESGQFPKWLTGTLNIVGGAFQVGVGAAAAAAVGWSGIGAVAGGFLVVNGAAEIAQGTGQIVNDVSNSNVMREDNIIRTGVQGFGKLIGGETGEKIARGAYDIATVAANLYAGKICLQEAGLVPIKVNINNVFLILKMTLFFMDRQMAL